MDESRRLRAKAAAEYLGISVRTLYNLPIRRIKIGAATVWDTRDLDIYMGLNAVTPNSREGVPRAVLGLRTAAKEKKR